VSFSTLELVVKSGDGRNFTLLEAFTFTRPNGEVITVHVGAQSDGASTPAIMWPTLPPFGAYWLAAFLHDFLYRYTQEPKDKCDTILKEAMEALNVGWLDLDAIYDGVAIGGESAFNVDRAAQAAI
jgi:hypothetical protein